MSADTSDRPAGATRHVAFAVTAAIWFLAKFLRYAFPALFPTFSETFGASNAVLGATFTAMMTVYSLMQFPSGALADRVGDVRIIAAGAAVAAAGALVVAVPAQFGVLVGGMVLVGLGTGAHKTVSITLLGRVYPARHGRALGLFDTVGTMGGVVAPPAVVALLAASGWRTLFQAGGVAGLVLAVAVLVVVPRQDLATGGPVDDDATLAIRPYLALFGDRRFALFVAATFAFGFAYTGVAAFLPLYLTDSGLAGDTASLLYSLLFVASFAQVVTGAVSDRLGRLPLAVASLSLAAVALGALLAVGRGGAAPMAAAVVAFGVGAHGFRPVRGAYLSAIVPDDASGGGIGLVRTLLMGVSAVAPTVVGVVADAAGFTVAFWLLVWSMAAAAVLVGAVSLVADDASQVGST
jgi:MFS family permease